MRCNNALNEPTKQSIFHKAIFPTTEILDQCFAMIFTLTIRRDFKGKPSQLKSLKQLRKTSLNGNAEKLSVLKLF